MNPCSNLEECHNKSFEISTIESMAITMEKIKRTPAHCSMHKN